MSDIPQAVEQETDEVADRILDEWEWLKGTDGAAHTELRNMQNEWLQLRNNLENEKEQLSGEDLLELQENLKVMNKKMRVKAADLIEKYKNKNKNKNKN